VISSLTAHCCCRPAPRKDTQQSCKAAQRHGRIAYPPVSSSYSMLCCVGVRKSVRAACRRPLGRRMLIRKVPDEVKLTRSACQSNWSTSSVDAYSELCLPKWMQAIWRSLFMLSPYTQILYSGVCGTRNRAASDGTLCAPWRSHSGKSRTPHGRQGSPHVVALARSSCCGPMMLTASQQL